MIVGLSDESTSPRLSTRAQRYAVSGVVHYRRPDTPEWRQGTIVNVSQSGVLFTVDETVEPGEALELSLELTSPLHATAVIARKDATGGGRLVAAKFDAFYFFESFACPAAR
jgi:hypothetical protein